MILSTTSSLVSVTTTTTADIDVQSSFTDNTTTDYTPIATPNVKIITAMTTTIVPSPGASTQRSVHSLKIRNIHASSSNGVTVLHTDGTVSVQVFGRTLLAGEEIQYDGKTFRVFSATGTEITTGDTGATGATGSRGTDGFPGFDGDDAPEPIVFPAQRGATGTTGATGATGIGRDGFPGLDGDDAPEPIVFYPQTPPPAGYSFAEDEGTPVTQRTTLNFVGAGVSVTDSGGKTLVTIAGGSGVDQFVYAYMGGV